MSRRRAHSTLAELPEAFVARQQAVLGDEADAFLAALTGPAVRSLRVNEHKASLAEVAERLRLTVDPVPWCPTATYLPPDTRLGDTVEHRAALFYLQEPSCTAVVEALGIEPHHRVLDIAAAPGGKATHAASRLGPDGLLLVNEVTSARLGPLLANLDSWGYPNTAITNVAAQRLADALPATFDRVIVDAPCSGEALFRRQPSARAEWSEAQVAGAARRQGKLLHCAARTVAPGGLLAYSTCTFAFTENEHQVAAFLDGHRDWELADISALPGAVVSPVSDADEERSWPGHALRFYPHRCQCEGQFVAVLRAPGQQVPGQQVPGQRADARQARTQRRKAAPPHPAWAEFARRTLRNELDQARVQFTGTTFYLRPTAMELPADLALRPGLLLGHLAGSTFRPAHALAMALKPAEVTAYEALGGDELLAFRQGLPVARAGPPGWVLVTVDRWPVGWARRRDDMLFPRLPGHARARG